MYKLLFSTFFSHVLAQNNNSEDSNEGVYESLSILGFIFFVIAILVYRVTNRKNEKIVEF